MSADKFVKIANALVVEINDLFDFGHILSDKKLKNETLFLQNN